MIASHGFAADSPQSGLKPFDFNRREVGPNDVLIDILYCGICHSDIHSVRDEWGGSRYPLVPGHEILGKVAAAGRNVKKFKAGQLVGVGCFVSSCGKCASCQAGDEQFCSKVVFTYGGMDPIMKEPTRGGYSDKIVVDHRYVLQIPAGQPLERVAPLLCAGITTYAPLKRAKIKRGSKVGIVGLGGLGHVAVKIAAAMGANVTVFSTSEKKRDDAKRLGAKNFVVTKDPKALEPLAGTFDFILDTVSAQHDINALLACLKIDGAMVKVGAPEKPMAVSAFSLIMGRRTLGGSLIGGIKLTQEMLNYCAKNKILADVEVIAPQKIDEAYDRTVAGDVKYRFVIDMKR